MVCLAAAVWAVACEDDNGTGANGGSGAGTGGGGGEGNALTLVGGTTVEQTVYADDTAAADIRFTAAAPWAVDVEEVRGSSVEWLTLSRYSGEAGEHTLTVTLRENLTGSSRKAKITIRSGEIAVTILIEQSGDKRGGTPEPPEPVVERRVKQIVFKEVRNSLPIKDGENCTKRFSYDGEGRVIRLETEYPNHTESWDAVLETAEIDYGTAGEIRVTETVRYGNQTTKQSDFIASLNEQGLVTSVRCKDHFYGIDTYQECMRYKYTPENYLAQEHCISESFENNFAYENGFWTKLEYRDLDNSDYDTVSTFELEKCYPNRYPNNGPIDFMCYFEQGLHAGVLLALDRLGRTGAYMPEVIPYDIDDQDGKVAPQYHTPNVTLHESFTYVQYPDTPECPISYTFDSDKVLTGFRLTQPFTVMQVDYDVVVSDEWMEPGYPEMGYKYTVQNRIEKKVREDSNTMTWEITYE